MYKNVDELCESVQNCYNYFMKLRRSFGYWQDGTSVVFKVGDKEKRKELGKSEFVQVYISALRALFSNAERQGLIKAKEGLKNYVFFPTVPATCAKR